MTVKSIPIDIENSQYGREITVLLDCFEGNDYIEPYSDVSLRIIIRIADILMFRYPCEPYIVDINDDIE